MDNSINQLTFIKPGSFEWREVAAPKIESATDALVRPLAVARCDLDIFIATGFVPMAGPFAFGHEMVGEVIDAGDRAGVTVGQRVIVPFQISCGTCDPCRRGFTASCQSVPPYSAFGLGGSGRKDYGGALGDYVKVPFADFMLVPVPDSVDSIAAASAADNIPDGWRAVAPQLAEYPGGSVLVVGGLAQSVGLYAAGAAVALGAGRVLYLEDNPGNRARAMAMGASAEPLGLDDGREHKEQFDLQPMGRQPFPSLLRTDDDGSRHVAPAARFLEENHLPALHRLVADAGGRGIDRLCRRWQPAVDQPRHNHLPAFRVDETYCCTRYRLVF